MAGKPLAFLCMLCILSFSGYAELQDQGLNSIMSIIDKAINSVSEASVGDGGEAGLSETAVVTIVKLSRILGTLSYSRLQCGEAAVLAEFTQRVQSVPEKNRDAMRDAFQEGFDKSKQGAPLLSEDECNRLTQSRSRDEDTVEVNVVEEEKKPQVKPVKKVDEKPVEDPILRHLRIAEVSGQLAYRRKFCDSELVFKRDFNAFINSVPDEFREQAEAAYWKGYKHGKRLNTNLTKDAC